MRQCFFIPYECTYDFFKYHFSREQLGDMPSDESEEKEKEVEQRKMFKQQSFLKKSQSDRQSLGKFIRPAYNRLYC